jgi:hypothetical protein
VDFLLLTVNGMRSEKPHFGMKTAADYAEMRDLPVYTQKINSYDFQFG